MDIENTVIIEDKKKVMLFIVQGGAGDVLSHTPMLRYWRKRHPEDEVVVVATYAHLLKHNPNVDTVIPFAEAFDIYDIYWNRLRFFKKHFVYDGMMDEPNFGCKTLPEFICRTYNAEYDGLKLDYYITESERKMAAVFMRQFQKPVVLVHAFGAVPSDGVPHKTHLHKDMFLDDIIKVVEARKEKYDFVQIGLAGEKVIPGALDALGMPMREAIALLPLCSTFIFVESLFAHCSNAVGVNGVVWFNNTNPEYFGHPNNVNLGSSGGCPYWPCCRPVGALMDLSPGYINVRTRDKLLWKCENQRCNRKDPRITIEAIDQFVAKKVQTGLVTKSLEEARK